MREFIIQAIKKTIQDITNNGDPFVVYLGKKFGKEIISIKNDNTKEDVFFEIPDTMTPYEIAETIYNTIKEMYPDSELNFFKHLCCGFGDTIHTDLILETSDKSFLFINDLNNLYKVFIEEIQMKDEREQQEKASNKEEGIILLQKKNED